MPLFSKDGGLWKSGINFFKDSGIWKQINILFLKDAGVWKEADTAVSPVNIRFEVRGRKGSNQTQVQNTNPNGSGPVPVSDPSRQGGNGGYTVVDMVVPTAYVIGVNDPTVRFTGGGTAQTPGYLPGGPSTGFSIDGEWMVIVGGGGSAGARIRYDSSIPGSPKFIVASFGAGGVGSGGMSNPTGTGSAGGTGGFSRPIDTPNFYENQEGGGGGAGAPGGGGGSGSGGGSGGGGNIRIRKDQGTPSGVLNVNPDWSMTFISGSNGTQTAGSVKITNKDSGGSTTLTSGNIPVENIKNL